MVNWYEKLTVPIKWCKQLCEKISVCIGTRQGGISSLLFNIFYQELVDALSKCPGGISINNDSFNVFCYADDLILTSLSVTGLQELIDTASSYIIAHGLNFNATKTICTSLGAKHFETTPEWHLNSSVLREEAAVTYLGTVLSSNPKPHFDTRIKSTTRAFYGLQCAVLCAGGVAPTVPAHMLLLLSTHSSLIIGGSPLLLSYGGSPPASPASHLAGLLRQHICLTLLFNQY